MIKTLCFNCRACLTEAELKSWVLSIGEITHPICYSCQLKEDEPAPKPPDYPLHS